MGECEGRDEGMFGLSLVVLVWMFTMASLGQKGYKHFFFPFVFSVVSFVIYQSLGSYLVLV